MRNKAITRAFYQQYLGFADIGEHDYPEYLLLERDGQELHFFLFEALRESENYGQIYLRTDAIDDLYRSFQVLGTPIHPNGALGNRPWGMREFSVLDPDHNLLTFGQYLS